MKLQDLFHDMFVRKCASTKSRAASHLDNAIIRNFVDMPFHEGTYALWLKLFEKTGFDKHLHESAAFVLAAMNKLGNHRRAYHMSKGLGELLANTSVKDVPTKMLRLPYPVMWLKMPRIQGFPIIPKITIGDPQFHVTDIILIEFNSKEGMQVEPSEYENNSLWASAVSTECLSRNGLFKGLMQNYSFIWKNLDLPDRDVESLYHTENHVHKSGVETTDTKARNTLARVIANAVLYCNSSNPDIVEWQDPLVASLEKRAEKAVGKKKENLQKKIDAVRRKVTILGRTIKVSNTQYRCNKTGKKGTPRTVGYWVQGHWRNQACGPRWSQRKLIWIQPQWRNRDAKEEIAPPHIVM